jgi:hypothetical protein
MDFHQLWNRTWRDKTGKVVIWQRPNVFIIGWVVLTLISLFFNRGNVADTFAWLSIVSLVIWCLLEIFKGVNYFRRALGVVVLLLAALLIKSNL